MDDGQANEGKGQEKTKRAKKSANFALEQGGQISAEGWLVWFQVKDGFVSPEKALAHIEEKQLEGDFRVVRGASPIYKATFETPKPVLTLSKVKPEAKKTTTPAPALA